MTRPSAPLLPACRLWEKTSASGTRYLVGRWGGVKVLILPNRERQGDNEASHVLLIAEAAPRPTHSDPASSATTQPSRRRPAPSKAEIADDPIPF